MYVDGLIKAYSYGKLLQTTLRMLAYEFISYQLNLDPNHVYSYFVCVLQNLPLCKH